MRPPRTSPTARAGFTLIELLVVIAIIAVLVGLTTAAVMNILRTPAVLQDRTDIQQLDMGIKTFHTKHGFYFPSRIRLCRTLAEYTNKTVPGSLDQKSVEYLNRMFNRLDWSQQPDWSGGLGLSTGGVILEGDQCLVFFLGGIPTSGGGTLGFSTDPRNPTKPGGERFRYFTFKTERLKLLYRGSPFYSYMNAHDNARPYAYFSSYGRENGYDTISRLFNPPVSDCASLNVWPYAASTTPTVRYHNSKTFQIVSAGFDGSFGPGGQWTPATAAAISANGRDDVSNFHDKILSEP
ncbi:MAG: prepilin-type N-terminal cleavage/methylation domain-containing protein [Gemmataceae bacterium]|nr:prepilin-type N-terminal cleavage/methylation domain-containing protein [Gemmataceae bacterium]